MGIIKQGILGGFSGKVAGVVGTSWKGRAVIKALPLSVANPKTEGQVAQRTSFSTVATIASALLTLICRVVFNPIAGNISGYNKFTSVNKQMFSGTGIFQPEQTKNGGGTLPSETPTTASQKVGTNDVECEWQVTAGIAPARTSDVAAFFAIDIDGENVWASSGGESRGDEVSEMSRVYGSDELSGAIDIYFFPAFVDSEGRLVSVQAGGTTLEVTFS